MANSNRPFGLRPVKPQFGGEERFGEYTIASAYGTSIYQYQPVVLTGTGRNIAAGAGTGEFLVGSFAGCRYIDSTGKPVYSKYWPASTAAKSGTVVKAYVYDDPDQEFEIQGDSTVFAAANVGLNADYTVGSGSTVTGLAASVLAGGGLDTTATLMLRVLGLSNREGAAWGAYAPLLVRINAHRLRSTTGA